ncbi:MAG: SRPBCC domain-containing protein [Crocinitomicaceae bacterium]|jgi:uncharacterized protein YndB with AHSA1/START domain
MEDGKITVEITVNKDLDFVWNSWTQPDHILKWNHASDDWHTVRVLNELKVGGKFFYRMEAKDGSFGFDFESNYELVNEKQELTYIMSDGRRATTIFQSKETETKVATTFDPENENPIELQKAGWQAILNNFKKYAESI